MANKKECNNCHRSISPSQFYSSNSSLFADKRVPFCKKCIREMMPEDDLDAIQKVLRQIDKPFLRDMWNKSKKSNNKTVGEYMKNINSLSQYRDLTWDDSVLYEDEGVNSVKSNTDTSDIGLADIDEVDTEYGTIKVTKELKSKWGNVSNREIIEMEKLYKEMEFSNDVSTPQHKKDLHFYCKLSILADKALDEDDYGGYEKLSRQLTELKKSAGFRPIDRQSGSEASGIRSFSQIYEELEKDGHIEPYPIQEKQDIVDRTIQYLLNYNLKLLNQEQLHQPPEDTPKLTPQETKEVKKDE